MGSENEYAQRIAESLKLSVQNVRKTLSLLDEDATVPFIARYRKEQTGSLDEVAVQDIADLKNVFFELDKRKSSIMVSLEKRDLLSNEMRGVIQAFTSLSKLEDYYLPLRPKRKTRASIAREKGLEPLASALFEQTQRPLDAKAYISSEKGVENEDEAWAGARDIIAERIAEDSVVRSHLRELFYERADISSAVIASKKEAADKFRDYFDWSELVKKCPSHRLLAMLRGEREGFLRVRVQPRELEGIETVRRCCITSGGAHRNQVETALEDSYKRLLLPSLETETFKFYREKSDAEAISVFADNLQELLLAAPLGRKKVMAIDPGFRTGCKVAALDIQGTFLENFTIFPSLGEGKKKEAAENITDALSKYGSEAIAVGNGTAGRETEAFIRELNLGIPVVAVDESGASVYSASECAREEFPDHDLTVRGAISIGRRLQDPMAELVKLDPKVIGVGQYQHDVDQSILKKRLDETVERCVNKVGVELNSASERLLTYVSGLGPQLAKNIVTFRKEEGGFSSRAQLKKVPRLGARAFEQAAGFLRIREGKNPLDASGVHPERYSLVKQMAEDAGCSVGDLMNNAEMRSRVSPQKYIGKEVGLPTLEDIMLELSKPGRDPRPAFESFSFSEEVHEVADLEEGMILPGLVTNVTRFGAFVDVGVHQDGLVHISQLADRFVKDPSDIVKVRKKVRVRVLEVDAARKRIALSMKGLPQG